MTAQDVAAALGMVPSGIGRGLLERMYWPDGAVRSAGQLDGLVCLLLHDEIARRVEHKQAAELALALARSEVAECRVISGELRGKLRRLEQRADDARAAMFPMVPERWPRLRRAVVDEVTGRALCPACSGRGQVLAGEVLAECEKCGGTGTLPVSDAARAAAIGVSKQAYGSGRWREMYEWLHGRLADALADARGAFMRAIG